MNTLQTGITVLMKSAITGEKLPLPEDFDIDAAYPVIKAHHITALAHAGALNCGIDQNKPAMQKLFQSYLRALQVNQKQLRELERVFSAFDGAGIEYLPLKGCVMKPLYPRPEMRLMGDADVLIREEQYDRIVPVMKALGFTEEVGAEHHYIWESGNLNLELHRYLIGSDILKHCDHLRNGWAHAEAESGMRYAMDDVNTFAFLFVHFTKHFVLSGIGCRHVVDLWVYLRSHPDMDQAYLKTVLEKMNLWSFCQNIRRLIGVWFEGEMPDERTEILTQVIFANGSWGHSSNAVLNKGVRYMGKTDSAAVSRIRYACHSIFPGVKYLENQYPVLNKHPWLLPAIWCIRLFKKTIMEKDGLSRQMKRLRLLNREELTERRTMMKYVGLSIDE